MSKVKSNFEIISDKSQNPVVDSAYVKHGTGWLDTVINQATSALNTKADKTYVDTQLATKANSSDVSALQTTVQSKADSSTVSTLSGRVTDVETEQDTLSARMDTFTALEDGSTTGDAELKDARIGADGKTYTNAGGAIRGQITDLKSDLSQKFDSISESTRNLWSYGNTIIVEKSVKIPVTLSKGKYTVSTKVTSTGTDASSCVMSFFDSSDSQLTSIYFARNKRTCEIIELSSACAFVRLFAETNATNSVGDTATYDMIQVESGMEMSKFISPVSAVDVNLRSESESIQNYTDNYVVVQGAIGGTGVINPTVSDKRARSKYTTEVKAGTVISAKSGFEFVPIFYKGHAINSSNFISIESVYYTEYVVESDTYLAFNIKKSDNSVIDASTLDASDVISVTFNKNGASSSTNQILYVSPAGSDANSGLDSENPLKTFNKAIEKGAKKIYAKRGRYTDAITCTTRSDTLEILPYESNSFSSSSPDRPLIVIDNGIELTSLTNNSGVLSQNFSGTDRFNKVFITKTLEPVITILSYEGYNVGVWQLHDNDSLDKELKPVLTMAELTTGTVYWDGATIYIKPYATDYTKFVVCGDNEYNIRIENVNNVILQDVCSKFSLKTNIQIRNSMNAKMQNCESLYTVLDDGVSLDNSNINLYKCMVRHSMSDGYNFHDYGESNLFDCESWYNLDDGISHHKGCRGTIVGGQYNYNGKGGNSPTTGSLMNMYNAILKGNQWGFYSVRDVSTVPRTHVIMNSLIIDNRIGIRSSGIDNVVISVNNVLSGNTYPTGTDAGGVINTYTVNDSQSLT